MPTSPVQPDALSHAQPDTQPGTPLVLVSGSGRSGTSSLAGTLKRLGLHVPQPEVEASETNPRGFYEPQWVIDFHKRHLKELALFNIDSRPAAVDIVARYVETGVPTGELHEWLAGQLAERQPGDQVVVKDPHAFWFAQVWEVVSAELGADLRWLTALRHPAEVVGSRDIAYLSSQPDELRLTKETSNVAGWVHAALLTEQAGRGSKRAFVKYVDLLADWRAALAPVQQQLELAFDTDLSAPASEREHHPVDDFIEPSMRKSQLTWDDVRTPDWLRDMAEEVWQLLGVLTTTPHDPDTLAALDTIHADYNARYADAVALTFDHTKAESTLAARQAREAQRATVQQLRRDLEQARRGQQAVVGGREAAAILRRAVVRRVTRR
ncbi:sulfotransferase family protein [Nocardioides sp. zg-1228]|uniref:sulfotransferase family protein n=1 Tax=Nocardioides sp. zg-1228 TaxID=2763008 RepID=UPI0016434D61|nr:sulfotransferase family protein [Nocardioides sp. zg-1228]MBC2931444.1 sulfotransferase family protein [Nocardioides sp. zg-1228]QSF57057.1 sulfotransferase family protein [Nocardioides sp. zg-1228]